MGRVYIGYVPCACAQRCKAGLHPIYLGVKQSTGEQEVLLLAGDMVLLADSRKRLESNLRAMSEVLSRWELKVNWTKL